jgi:hypothetical protein
MLMPGHNKRIFLGTVEIAGFFTTVAAGLRQSGVDCRFVELNPHPFQYSRGDASLPGFVELLRRLETLRSRLFDRAPHRRLASLAVYAVALALRTLVILPWAIARFDVFCFGFNTNIVGTRWGYWDIALLRRLGKRVVFLFFGADGRPPYMTGPYVHAARARGNDWPAALCELTRQRKRAIRTIERHADVVAVSHLNGHFFEKRFVDFMHLGMPFGDRGQSSAAQDAGAGAPPVTRVRILHAPSDRAAKGSDLISACIERLKAKGHDIDYVEIHGLPHDGVVKEIERCDFVIDQLYADAPMAGFATEAAAHGKPSVVCGYIQDRAWLDAIPTHYCHPDELDAAVLRLVSDRDYRLELGRRASRFVAECRSDRVVTQKLLRIFDGTIPEDWWYEPRHVAHLHGGGLSEGLLRETLRRLVADHGAGVLQLDDKPGLRDRILGLVSPRPGARPAPSPSPEHREFLIQKPTDRPTP